MKEAFNNLSDNKYLGDKDFEKFLIEADIPLTVWEIKSFVLGIVIGVEFLQPNWVIEELLLIGTDSEIQLKDEKEFKEFLSKFFGLWNEMASLQNTNKSPKLSPILSVISNEELAYAVSIREHEYTSFLGGLAESGSLDISEKHKEYHEAIELLEEVHESLITIESILDEYATEIEFTRAKHILDHSQKAFEVAFPVISRTLFRIRTS